MVSRPAFARARSVEKRGARPDIGGGAQRQLGIGVGADQLVAPGPDRPLVLVAVVPVPLAEDVRAAGIRAGAVNMLAEAPALHRLRRLSAPATSSSVGARSTVLTSPRSYTDPARMTRGQEKMSGVRVPPSYKVPFSRGNGAPLSLRNTISVLSRSFRRSSSASMRPIVRVHVRDRVVVQREVGSGLGRVGEVRRQHDLRGRVWMG